MTASACLALSLALVVVAGSVASGGTPPPPTVVRGVVSPALTAKVLSVKPITPRRIPSKSRSKAKPDRDGPAVTGGSGMFRIGQWTLVAQDDSSELAAISDDGRVMHVRVFDSDGGRDRFHPAYGNKNRKPDVEAIARVRMRASSVRRLGGDPGRKRNVDAVVLFGSGSIRGVRDRMAVIVPSQPLTTSVVRVVTATGLYDRLRAAKELTGASGQLNLEAAAPVADGTAIRLYNRGNSGPDSVTASVDISGQELLDYFLAASADSAVPCTAALQNPTHYDLGTSDGFAISIGEAIALPTRVAVGGAGALLIAGIAEATTNAIDDGATSGTVIGLQLAGSRGLLLAPVMQDGKPSSLKIEGLALTSMNVVGRGGSRRLVMRVRGVVDTDSPDPLVPSDLVELEVSLALQ